MNAHCEKVQEGGSWLEQNVYFVVVSETKPVHISLMNALMCLQLRIQVSQRSPFQGSQDIDL